jgi:hypothetical protein
MHVHAYKTELSQSATSHQLKVLRDACRVKVRREGHYEHIEEE